jgi:hypothetical protein
MKIYLTDQKNNLKSHLDALKSRKVMTYDKTRLTESITAIDLDIHKPLSKIDLDFCLTTKYFPTIL